LPEERALLCEGKRVEVGSRAFDLLVCLVRSPGQIVSKAQIIAHVWPALFVEESNLRFQVAQLRKALGAHSHLIKTVPGRGYLLAVPSSEAFGTSHRKDEGAPGRLDKPQSSNGGTPLQPAAGNHSRSENGTPIVAVIDPDDEAAQNLSLLLWAHDLDPRPFPSAEAFLAAGIAAQVECVILDVWLPGRNGLQLQAEFATSGALVPFIFVSSHADVDAAVRAMKAGASEFFTKPLRHLDLVEAVRRAVGYEDFPGAGAA
jgi:DNA-binding response OmpR family regulator